MKPLTDTSPSLSSSLLTIFIVLAQIDMNGLLEYALKAGVGGGIWLGYKIIADLFDRYRKKEKTENISFPNTNNAAL